MITALLFALTIQLACSGQPAAAPKDPTSAPAPVAEPAVMPQTKPAEAHEGTTCDLAGAPLPPTKNNDGWGQVERRCVPVPRRTIQAGETIDANDVSGIVVPASLISKNASLSFVGQVANETLLPFEMVREERLRKGDTPAVPAVAGPKDFGERHARTMGRLTDQRKQRLAGTFEVAVQKDVVMLIAPNSDLPAGHRIRNEDLYGVQVEFEPPSGTITRIEFALGSTLRHRVFADEILRDERLRPTLQQLLSTTLGPESGEPTADSLRDITVAVLTEDPTLLHYPASAHERRSTGLDALAGRVMEAALAVASPVQDPIRSARNWYNENENHARRCKSIIAIYEELGLPHPLQEHTMSTEAYQSVMRSNVDYPPALKRALLKAPPMLPCEGLRPLTLKEALDMGA